MLKIMNAMTEGIDDGGDGRGVVAPRPAGVRGIRRRKHALRAAFRSSSLLLLLGGCGLRHRFLGRGGAGGPGDGRPGSGAVATVGTSRVRRRAAESIDVLRPSEDGARLKSDGDGTGAAASSSPPTPDPDCPVPDVADPRWHAALYAFGTVYMFLALAVVCDEFFVPALEEMGSERRLGLSMDVAGATLMAAGGSAPDLFANFVGTFRQSDIGIGAIVGAAVFNALFVLGACSLVSEDVLSLTRWPLVRDSLCYVLGLVALSAVAGVGAVAVEGEIRWWGALVLLAMYGGYILVIRYNRRLYKRFVGKELVLAKEGDRDTMSIGEDRAMEILENRSVDGDTPLLSDDSLESSSDHNRFEHAQKTLTTFHRGVLQLFLRPEAWREKGGVRTITKIYKDIGLAFEGIGMNEDGGDGGMSKEELGRLLKNLGHEICQEELDGILLSLNLGGDRQISKEVFLNWYVGSEEHILSKVKPIFDAFDANKTGTVGRTKIRRLLKTLEPRVADNAITAMIRMGRADEGITLEEFVNWYVRSAAYFRSNPAAERTIEEDPRGGAREGPLSPPRGEGARAWATYLFVLPVAAALTLTIPDVRRPGAGGRCYASFLLSIAWIGVFSYFMVDWIEVLGGTVGVPSVVMGYTVLAAGSSVPDMLASVIVARMGEADMALSNSIGSNIFDLFVALPLPWLIFTLWPSTPNTIVIQSKGFRQSILILIGLMVIRGALIHCHGWKLTRTLGGLMFVLYIAFLAQAITVEYFRDPCF